MMKCEVCNRSSEVKSGWHLKNGFNFCSNKCVAKFIERLDGGIVSHDGTFCVDREEHKDGVAHSLYPSRHYRCIVKGCHCFDCGHKSSSIREASS